MELICIALIILTVAFGIGALIGAAMEETWGWIPFILFLATLITLVNYGPSNTSVQWFPLEKNVDYKLTSGTKMTDDGVLVSIFIQDKTLTFNNSFDVTYARDIRILNSPETKLFVTRQRTHWGGGEIDTWMKTKENGKIYWFKLDSKNSNLY